MLRPKPFSHAAFDYQPEQLGKRTVAFDKAWPRVFLANGASTHAQLERLRQRLADYLRARQGEFDPDILEEKAVRALVKRKRTHS
jgi:hypothetical protein